MQNSSPIAAALPDEGAQPSLQAYFRPGLSPDDIEQVHRLRRAQPLLQGFTALFYGGSDSILVRLLVLHELASVPDTSTLTRADINARLGYLEAESLETVLYRLRSHQLLNWDAGQGVYRVTPLARNILSAIDSLMALARDDDEAEMGFLLSQVAGSQAVGGVTVEQLQHLLGRMVDLTEEFRDAIASGSEFRLRAAQEKWHTACDWVEKGSQILQAITNDPDADAATHRAAQAIGRAQSALLNMQGMFSRALNQIERQRVHLGQSGLSTTDIKTWLMQHEDLAGLASNAVAIPVTPMFITPSEMIDVAEAELFADRNTTLPAELPKGEDASIVSNGTPATPVELDAWLNRLGAFAASASADNAGKTAGNRVQDTLLPANFAVASYRASLLPLLGDESEASLQGGTATMARLPLEFTPQEGMVKLKDPHVAAMSNATLALAPASDNKPEPQHD
ncbi:hypothetical protein RY831_23680 [Noviherbaspirillum sp. CPCC 100848]|uniref:DUF3375 domain-containing protein n=1 Tax=Noviherbaspirillum album TaxID=3080276 RepID=A0ABU6JFW2_9BURK|nr:hypothetical protein [Noviherbaspirillum sp. CPCC 100848]MEC4722170.1 hypothetical protein [Noviherbaspirillum sp. CPCC 100848]